MTYLTLHFQAGIERLKNGEKKDFAEKFLNNELNVLLTRGVNGMYIYAVDAELRAALKNSLVK